MNSGQTVHTSTIESLRTYMIHQEQQTGLHRLKKTKEKTKGKQGGSTDNKNSRKQRGKRSAKNSSNQGSATRKRLDNDADCPLHNGSHTWGQCHQNQYGESFRPKRDNTIIANANSRRSARSSGSQTSRQGQGQYHTQQAVPRQASVEEIHSVAVVPAPSNEVLRFPNLSRSPHKRRRYEYYFNEIHQVKKKMKQSSEAINYSPEGYTRLEGMNGITANLHCLGLFDSGSTSTLLNKRSLPEDVQPQTGHPQQFTTTQGNYVSDRIIKITKIFFPQFCKARYVPNVSVRIFDSPTSQYDIIFGRDVLTCGFLLDHSTK